MPGGMTGGDLAAELKKRKPGLKVIYASGYSSVLTGKDFSQGDNIFLAKPYQPNQVARLIRNTIDAPPKEQPPPAPAPTMALPSRRRFWPGNQPEWIRIALN